MGKMAHDPQSIANWQRLSARATTSGRLEVPDIKALAACGVAHVINLALADSPGALANEAELLVAHGLRYSHVPVPFDAPDDSHFAAFRAALEGDDQPVHVHCILNWRVSAFFYRWHRDCAGMPEPQARTLMERQWSPHASNHPAAGHWQRFLWPDQAARLSF